MQEVFEKIIEKLQIEQNKADEKCKDIVVNDGHSLEYEFYNGKSIAYKHAIEIVKQEAEQYNNGWIPCSVELPPQPAENPIFDNKPLELYLVSVKNADYPIRAFWNGKFFSDGWSKVDVIAWQPLPKPFQKGD